MFSLVMDLYKYRKKMNERDICKGKKNEVNQEIRLVNFFSIKGHIIKVLGLRGHMVSNTAT